MEGFIPDSFCGLYCGACDIMHLYRRCQERGTAARWEDLPAPLRDNIPKAEVRCHGCRSDTVFAGCRDCRVRTCARNKGVVACVVCSDFPCAEVASLRELAAKVKAYLPHTATISRDSEVARQRGYQAWAEAQRARWRCPSCGTPFTWYQRRCGTCGLELRADRGY